MKKSKIKNIVIDKIAKKAFGGSQNEILISRVVDETLKAINYSQCCKSDSEQLPDANKHQCNCSNAKDRLDCGFECYNK